MLPAVAASNGAVGWLNAAASTDHTGGTEYSGDLALEGGSPPGTRTISVDGSLPEPPDPENLTVYELPAPGPLGIPGTALAAYRNAAQLVGREQPDCNIDWALVASIGRIESNHARGGYVDVNGDTLEPILGPVLNGVGPVAAIPDTDQGRHDGDAVWDRAVGPTQFIPGTWARYGADGNDDGVQDPNNIYDATVATARYLCSGGLDLSKDDQLRAALYRYNNSDTYVETVIRWAKAYRNGVATLPDSDVPLAVPKVTTREAPSPVDPPSASATPRGRSAATSAPPATSGSQLPPDNSGPSIPPDTTNPTTPTKPDEPEEPTEPTEPTDPTDPSEPGETCEPPDSTSPTPTPTPTEPDCEESGDESGTESADPESSQSSTT